MPASDPSKEPVAELVSRLEAISDDEVFAAMDALETASGEAKDAKREEILSRIALTEMKSNGAFPGKYSHHIAIGTKAGRCCEHVRRRAGQKQPSRKR